MILSCNIYEKVTVRIRIVHRTFAAVQAETCNIFRSVAQISDASGSLPGNNANNDHNDGMSPMKRSSLHCSNCADALHRLPRNGGRAMIWLYRHTLSPIVGFHCRHVPTCSVYGDEAIGRFGLWAGGWMTLARLLRCQPWGTSGIDNVPLNRPETARWYLPWRFGRWRGVNAP
jgi:uncharacterized protein